MVSIGKVRRTVQELRDAAERAKRDERTEGRSRSVTARLTGARKNTHKYRAETLAFVANTYDYQLIATLVTSADKVTLAEGLKINDSGLTITERVEPA